jgi:Na+-translocating ferredoxin:NAD+ oxidoreductase RnfG subunit
MRPWQFMLLLVIGIACVCLSLVTIVFARQNRQLQEALQAQQTLINKGALSQQVGNNLLREMAALAQTDEQMHKLLQDHGFNLSASPTPRP